jgi:hypothetical protein
MRDRDGEIRKKRSDTLVGTLRKTYGSDFAKGYRSDTKLGTPLDKQRADTLDQLPRDEYASRRRPRTLPLPRGKVKLARRTNTEKGARQRSESE